MVDIHVLTGGDVRVAVDIDIDFGDYVDLDRMAPRSQAFNKRTNSQTYKNLGVGTKVVRVFLLAIHSHIPPPPPHSLGAKVVETCNVNIVCGKLKTENSQDYAQKPQQNCTFINSASGTRSNPILFAFFLFFSIVRYKYCTFPSQGFLWLS